jgi:serine/threonine protein kinase
MGGFGIVYIAWDNNLDVRAAIKEFLPKEYAARSSNHVNITAYTGNASEEFSLGVEKFLEEAKALARFQDHPGIVTVHESFRANNTAYMVMQYLDGMTMKEYLKRQPGEKISFDVAVKAMTPIMDALREVHHAGFVHRDISPDNIFFTNNNQVKLLDFGSARYAIGEHSKSLTSVLKHGYAPVEQYSVKGRQGPWSDVYAVCATLYRCVTGIVPPDAMERMQGDSLHSPRNLGIEIPQSGERAIMRGMALKATDRFENIQQLQQVLGIGTITSQKMGYGDVIQPIKLSQKIIECPHCGAKNQLNPGDDLNALLCGKCQKKFGMRPVAIDSAKERNASAIDLGGYKYIPMENAKGEAFCLGCRSVDSANKLYYCRQIDTYYHKQCLIKKKGGEFIANPHKATTEEQNVHAGPMYFAVSPLKLIVMSVCTFSIYQLFWFYMNWTYIKERERLDIEPFWRSFFAFFFCHSCFQKIRTTAQSLNISDALAVGPLAAGWIIVSILWKLPDPYWLICFFSVFFLVPVQILVNKVNAKVCPLCEENKNFTSWNIVGIVFGIIWLILIFIGFATSENDSALKMSKNIEEPAVEAPVAPAPAVDTPASIEKSLMAELEKEASKMNATLPKMVANGVRADKLLVGPGKKVTYRYTLVNVSSSNVNDDFYNNVKQELIKDSCGTLKIILQNGVTFLYEYYGNDGIMVAAINLTPADCGY